MARDLPCSSGMPSIDHEALVELFRSNPALAGVLLALIGGIRTAAGKGRVVDSNLTVLPPHQWRPDLVLIHGEGEQKQAVIVEVQLSRDSDKAESWPEYITATRRRHHCPACLLVVAGDTAMARWCARKLETGHPGFDLRPIVVGPQQLPPLTDPELARRCPELAILSTFLHRRTQYAVDAAVAAAHATAELDERHAIPYNDLIVRWLAPEVRPAFEEKIMSFPDNYVCQSDFAKKHQAKGRTEGRAASVLTVLRSRGLSVEAEHEERIRTCGDVEQFDRWLQRVASVSSPDELFAE